MDPTFTNTNNTTTCWINNLENITMSSACARPFTYLPQIPSSPNFLTTDMLGIHLQQQEDHEDDAEEEEGEAEAEEELGAMKEMMYKIAAMQPVDIDPASISKPKRRNVRISEDPQSVAARRRRERISEKIRILGRLVPGGTKLDTASMLDEAIRYVKFLKRQIRLLQSTQPHRQHCNIVTTTTTSTLGLINNTTPDWPLASTTLHTSAAAVTGFNGGDSSSGFNHEVISEKLAM